MKVEGVERLAIVGASARAAAFSALRAGYEVVAADLFADADLRRVAAVERIADYPSGFVEWMQRVDCDAWLYTGGLENHPDLIARLSQFRPLLGNGNEALKRCRDPFTLAEALAASGLPFPETRRLTAGLPQGGTWLCKTYRSAGGAGVWRLDGVEARERAERHEAVYQRFVDGTPAAAAFVCTSAKAVLLGVTRQVIGDERLGAKEFRYAGSMGPLAITQAVSEQLQRLGGALVSQFQLRGVVGVDFVLSGDDVWVVEINPRYPASAEVLELASGFSVVGMHLAACIDDATSEFSAVSQSNSGVCHSDDGIHSKAIVFAKKDMVVSQAFSQWALEHSSVEARERRLADVPGAGAAIAAGQPVVSVFAAEAAGEYDEALMRRVAEVERRLYGD